MDPSYFPLKSLKFQSTGWEITTYQRYSNYIENELSKNEKVKSLEDLIAYCEKHPEREAFRWEVEIGSVYFLAGVFVKEKEILLCSKQLGMELSLISLGDSKEDKELVELSEKIAQIPSSSTPAQIEYLSYAYDLPLFNEQEYLDVLTMTEAKSTELISKVNEYKQSLFERISNFSLDLTANFMLIRIHLLKFLAILPCLDHDKEGREVKRILKETLSRLIKDSATAKEKKLKGQSRSLPKIYIYAATVVLFLIRFTPAKLLAYLVRSAVSLMAKRFIAGENISRAEKSLQGLLKSGRDATIDQLGELVVSTDEAEDYKNKVLDIIRGLSKQIDRGDRNASGILRAHVSIKVTALTHNFTPQNFDYCYEIIGPRLREILIAAKEAEVFINIDAEHYHFRDSVLDIYSKVLLDTEELADFKETGIVIQAYLRDAYKHFLDVLSLAKKRKLNMPIRLVKGAYWDAETIEAQAHNFPAVQFLNKEETDIHFRQMIAKTLEHGEHLQLAIASHNIQDHAFSETLRDAKYPNSPAIEHQCLHMTYEALSVGLAKMNWATRNYIPVGNLLVGMAYLVRRIMENSSQVGVLTMMRSHKKAMNYKGPTQIMREKKNSLEVIFDDGQNVLTQDFKNIYPLRTYLEPHLKRIMTVLDQDLAKIESGKLFFDNGDHEVFCSSKPSLKLGQISYASVSESSNMVEALFTEYMEGSWKSDIRFRLECLFRLSDELLMNRERLCSLIMLEAGKTIDEAVADVDEAIDFIQFYIREQAKVKNLGDLGARGVVGIIAPWNFPLAIPCGMSVAALVAGNTAILKPAEQTPLIAMEFHRLAIKAGIPENVFKICLGEGDIGANIVQHELVNGVVFTGSKKVGCEIYKKVTTLGVSERYKSGSRAKFAITEMGGKNAIIVTNNCELDETVSGILYSSFAHAGQKCSAASRIIIDEKIKDSFKARFKKAVEDLKVGESFDTATYINPLASLADKQRVQALAKKAAKETQDLGGEIVINLSEKSYPGYCVGPSVFELSSEAVLKGETVATEEVFGPLIHLIPYQGLDEAIKIFNSTDYALTGGIYCQSQNDIDYLKPRLLAGNIYINRPNTGARVAIEPFGGFKMSGTGPKAGSSDYLQRFNTIKVLPERGCAAIFEGESIVKHAKSASKLNSQKIQSQMKTFLTSLINKFSEIFGVIDEDIKFELQQMLRQLDVGTFDLANREFPNREIPGQLSYNKRDIKLGKGYLFDFEEKVESQKIIDTLINMIVGNGLTIVTTSQKNYDYWLSFVNLSYKHGFSDFNICVSKVNSTEMGSFVKKSVGHFYIFRDFLSSKPLLQDLQNGVDYLAKVIYSHDHISHEVALTTFTHTRSFAVNTMRHGAPLTMEL